MDTPTASLVPPLLPQSLESSDLYIVSNDLGTLVCPSRSKSPLCTDFRIRTTPLEDVLLNTSPELLLQLRPLFPDIDRPNASTHGTNNRDSDIRNVILGIVRHMFGDYFDHRFVRQTALIQEDEFFKALREPQFQP